MKRVVSLFISLALLTSVIPTVTTRSSSDDTMILINSFHKYGSASGSLLTYDENSVFTQNGATLTVSPQSKNHGNGFVLSYGGEKLSFHGANDEARKDNSGVEFKFSAGTNPTADSLTVLEFSLSTNAPGRTYASAYYGNTLSCNIANANSEFSLNTKHKIRIEAESRSERIPTDTAVKVTVSLDGRVLNTQNLTQISSDMTLVLSAYKTPAVVLSDLCFSVVSDSAIVYKAYANYMNSLTERSRTEENAEIAGDISNLTSIASGLVKKDSGGSWKITNNPSGDGGKSIYFDPESQTNTRIVVQNLWNIPIMGLQFDMYFPSLNGRCIINFKTDSGWISDRIIVSDSQIKCDGSGNKWDASFRSGRWHRIGIIFDAESDKLWFTLDGKPIYMSDSANPFEYLSYIEILGNTNVYYIDNFTCCSYYQKKISDVTASFYVSGSEPDSRLCANVEFTSDSVGKKLTVYGAVYDKYGDTAILKYISKNDVVIDENTKSIKIDLGETGIGTVARLFCFDSESIVTPLFKPYSRYTKDIEKDVIYMNFENPDTASPPNGATIWEQADGKVLRAQLSSDTKNLKFDALCTGDFVISFDISADSAINGDLAVYGGGTPAYLLKFDSDKKITLWDGTPLCEYTDKMTTLTLVYSYEDKCFDFYKNGNILCKGYHPGVTFDKCVYFEFTMSSPQKASVYLDNICIYPSYVYTDKCFYYNKYSKPIDHEREIILSSKTSIPQQTNELNIMRDKASLHIRSGVAFDGSQKYMLSHLPYRSGDEIMVPGEFFENVFDLVPTQNGDKIKLGSDISLTVGGKYMTVSSRSYSVDTPPQITDGVLYLPLKVIAEKALKKYILQDNTTVHPGMIVISDSPYTLPVGDELQALNDFCFYYRPDARIFRDSYLNSRQAGVHPRIMATDDDFERLRTEIKTNATKANWYANLIEYCDSLKDEPPLRYELRDGVRLMYVSDDFENRMIALAAAYKLSGDRKYFDYAWKHIESVANMPDWNPSHHIDVGIMALGYAVAYDWFYDILSDSQRKLMEKGAYNNCLRTLNDAVESDKTPYGWVMMENNHNVFVNAGNMAVCLAFMDVYPEICSKLGADIVRIVECFLDKFAPSGQYYEGPHYATIAIDYTARLFSVMEKTVGLFGLDKAQGFDLIGDYLTYMQSDVSNFNFADGEPGFVSSSGLFWLYSHYGIEGAKDNLANGFYSSATRDEAAQCILWYDTTPDDETQANSKLDIHYPEEEIITMRDSFAKGQVFVGIKAGDTVYDHSHYDTGSFVYDALGTRWAHDLGKDDYNLYYKYSSKDVFRVRAESHNVLLISPDSTPGFDDNARATVTEFVSTPNTVKTVIDMTEVYGSRVLSAKRGFIFTDNRKSLVVRDEVSLDTAKDMYWLMYTDSDITIPNDKTAILTDKYNPSKKVKVEFVSSVPGSISVQPASPFPSSVQIPEQNRNEGFQRLMYTVYGNGNITITAKITPVGYELTDVSEYDIPLSLSRTTS